MYSLKMSAHDKSWDSDAVSEDSLHSSEFHHGDHHKRTDEGGGSINTQAQQQFCCSHACDNVWEEQSSWVGFQNEAFIS